MGYSLDHNGYMCLHHDSGRTFISRDVIFCESTFSFFTKPISAPIPNPQLSTKPPIFIPIHPQSISCIGPSHTPFKSAPSPLSLGPSPLPTSDHIPSSPISPNSQSPSTRVTNFPSKVPALSSSSTSPPIPDFIDTVLPLKHSMVTRSQTNSLRSRLLTDGTIMWPPPKPTASLATSSTSSFPTSVLDEPTSYTKASKHLEWQSAMATELDALLFTRTWDLVPPSFHYNILGSKWVLKAKHRVDGIIEHQKVRLVAQGFHQQ